MHSDDGAIFPARQFKRGTRCEPSANAPLNPRYVLWWQSAGVPTWWWQSEVGHGRTCCALLGCSHLGGAVPWGFGYD